MKTWGVKNCDPEPLHYQAHKSGQISDMEDVIYEKIRQRTHACEDEGRTVKNFFKYYDVQNTGTVNLQQFEKGLEVLGCVFTKAQIK